MKNSEYYAIGYFESISSKNFQNLLTIFDVCDIIKMKLILWIQNGSELKVKDKFRSLYKGGYANVASDLNNLFIIT